MNKIRKSITLTLVVVLLLFFSVPNKVAFADGWVPPTAFGINQADVYCFCISGNDLYAGGDFTMAGGIAANRIAKWNGTTWSPLGSGMNGSVYSIAKSGSNLYAGGNFTTAGDVPASNIAKWNGNSWSSLGSGVNGVVRSIAISGSDIYIGGDFTAAGGMPACGIAKWNGDSWSPLGSGVNDVVRSIAISGNNVYAGGNFTVAGDSTANYIAKWNGTNWLFLGSGMNGPLYSIAISGSALYAGGYFTTAGGSAANYIAKWDGTEWSALGSGMNGRVYSIAKSGSDLYAGGDFTTAGGSAANYMAKWNGSSWSSASISLTQPIQYIATSETGDLYASVYPDYFEKYDISPPVLDITKLDVIDNYTGTTDKIQGAANAVGEEGAFVKAYPWTDSSNDNIVDSGELGSAIIALDTSYADGSFCEISIGDNPAGTYKYVITATDYYSNNESAKDVSHVLTLNLVKNDPSGTVTGMVIGSDNSPISGATAGINGINSSTNSLGSFTLTDIPVGVQTMTITASGYNQSTSTVDVLLGQSINAGTITLNPTPAKLANDAIADAKALLPSTLTAIEGVDSNLLTNLNAITGMSASGVSLSLYSANANIASNGAITYGGTPVTGSVTVHINKASGTEVTHPIFVTVPAISSSSSGGRSTSTVIPQTDTTVSENTVTATTSITATTDLSGNAAAAVTREQISDAIGKAVAEAEKQGQGVAATIEIKVTAPAGSRTVETNIPKTAISEIADKNEVGLTVSTPIASLAFDKNALNTISQETTEDVKITASVADASILSEEAKQIVGDRPVFDFSVTSGNKVISQFGGNVSISVPYMPKPGEDINAIVIYYINSDGKPEAVADCSYDPKTGMITFTTNHFSRFAVGYHKVAFHDVAPTAWYSDAVSFVAAREITTGTGGGNYSPKAKLTRGQFLVMIMRAYGIPADADSKDNFSDAGSTYYTGYLAAAKRLGLSGGIGDNMFVPEKEITRQEMFTLLYNTQKQINDLPTATTGKTPTLYSDSKDIAVWAKDAMKLFAEAGIISGSGSKLSPTGTATRAEMAQVLYNLLTK